MAGDGRRAGTASGHAFDLATGVRGGPERWVAEVDPGWTVAGRPNGGYLLALVARAALEAVGQPRSAGRERPLPGPRRPRAGRGGGARAAGRAQPVHGSGHPGPGRAGAAGGAGHRRADRPGRGARVAAGDRAGRVAAGGACVPGRPEMPGGMRANLLDHLDLRVDPATTGWFVGRPGGRLEMRGWVRFCRRARRRPAGPAPGGRRAAPDQLRPRPGELGPDGRADRLPARRPRARLAGRCRERPALAGRLVRRGRRGLGLGRPPGRPVPPARRRPPPAPAGDAGRRHDRPGAWTARPWPAVARPAGGRLPGGHGPASGGRCRWQPPWPGREEVAWR